jgi:glycosyltransferase involved in cell wall biosynthesis
MSSIDRNDDQSRPQSYTTHPLISVVIPVYNAGPYFRPSLESILRQTYSKLEIIVVDDGSTDGCVDSANDLIADSRVRLFRQANASKPVALNRALDQIHGEFYATHDADDISHRTRMEKQIAALLGNPDLAAVYCGSELIIGGRPMAPVFAAKSEDECRRAIESFRMPAHDPTGMYRMSLVGHMRYDESLPYCEGVDYILRIGEQHPMSVIGECLYQYRILDTSITRRDPAQRERHVVEMLRRACERRGLQYADVFPNGRKFRSRNSLKDNNIMGLFVKSVLEQKRLQLRWKALATGFECTKLHPFDFDYYKPLIWALMPTGVIRLLQR